MQIVVRFFLFSFLFSSFQAFGQGELVVYDYYGEEYRILVEQNDSIVIEDVFLDSITIQQLRPGTYTVSLLKDQDPYITFYDVEVEDGERTWLMLPEESYTEPIYLEWEDVTLLSFHLDFLFGPKSMSEAPFRNQSYELRSTQSVVFPLSRLFFIGVQAGADLRWSYFDKDTNVYSLPPLNKERYFSFNYLIGTYFRFAHFNHTDLASGPFVDLGVNYSLPIIFRHSYQQGNQKIVTRRLHQWNDLSAYVRIGYAPVAVIAEYRLFDTVRGPFPEMPKFRVGISLTMAGNAN